MNNIILDAFSKFLSKQYLSLSITKLNTGLSESQIFKVNLLNTNQEYLCKLFPIAYEDRIKNSIKIEDYLNKYNYPFPKTLYVDFQFAENLGFLIQEYIEGKTFYQRIVDGTVNPDVLINIANNLAYLHGLAISEEWQNKKAPCFNGSDWIKIVKKWCPDSKLLSKVRKIDIALSEYLEKEIKDFILLVSNSPIKLCPLHWDYNPQNILLKNDKVAGIIDFESHRIGDNHAELGIIMYWFRFYDVFQYFDYFLKAYEKITNSTIETERILGYYTFHLLTAYKHLFIQKPTSKAYKKVKAMVKELNLNRQI